VKAAILQSGYLPWLGYFALIDQVDCFVFFDDVQWTVRDWRNRNRIRTPQGWNWLTVPVSLEKPYYEYQIKDVKIDYSQNWQSQHLNSLQHHYKKTPFYNEVLDILENALNKNHKFVIDLNYDIVLRICDMMGIKDKKILFSQDMGIRDDMKNDDRLLAVLNKIGGIDIYVSGPAAKAYLDENKFGQAGIKVEWQDYHHPYYRQQTWGSNTFISHLSAIDLLFNHGAESLPVIRGELIVETPSGITAVKADDFKK
jgi:hypothetical protein